MRKFTCNSWEYIPPLRHHSSKRKFRQPVIWEDKDSREHGLPEHALCIVTIEVHLPISIKALPLRAKQFIDITPYLLGYQNVPKDALTIASHREFTIFTTPAHEHERALSYQQSAIYDSALGIWEWLLEHLTQRLDDIPDNLEGTYTKYAKLRNLAIDARTPATEALVAAERACFIAERTYMLMTNLQV